MHRLRRASSLVAFVHQYIRNRATFSSTRSDHSGLERCCCCDASQARSICHLQSTLSDLMLHRSSMSSSIPFSVATFNVLADAYARPNSYPHCKQPQHQNNASDQSATTDATTEQVDFLSWSHRSKRLIQIIKKRNPTILCLQECDHFHEFWSSELTRLGYDCVYVQRGEQTPHILRAMQGDPQLQTSRQRLIAQRKEFKTNQAATADDDSAPATNRLAPLKDDGCCVAFKRDQCQLAATPWPVDMNNIARGKHVNNRTHLSSHRYLKQNVGLIIALRLQNELDSAPASASAPVILVSCLHVHWDPACVDVKTRQVAHMMHQTEAARAELQRLALQRLPPRAVLEHRAVNPKAARHIPLDEYPFTLTLQGRSHHFAHRPTSLDFIDPSAALPLSPPLICCGDFNSSPSSDVYRYMLSGAQQHDSSQTPLQPLLQSRPPSPDSAALRFLVDVDCIKLARWLRALGIDCVHWSSEQHAHAMDAYNADPQHNAPPSQCMFDLAMDEPHLPRRILLTKSKSLVQRRNCPPHYMLLSNHHNNRQSGTSEFDAMFIDVCRAFDIRFDQEKLYSRRTLCDAAFESVSAEQLLQEAKCTPDYDPQMGSDKIPPLALLQPGARLRGPPDDAGGETRIEAADDINFHRCINQQCSQTYWIGPKSDAMANRIRQMLAQNDDARTAGQQRAGQSHSSHRRSNLRPLYSALQQEEESAEVSDSEMRNSPSAENGEVQRVRASLRNALALSRHALRSGSIEPHSFALQSAYATATAAAAVSGAASSGVTADPLKSTCSDFRPDRCAVDESSRHEPACTNCTAAFKGCLDYIFFSGNKSESLKVEHSSPLQPSNAHAHLSLCSVSPLFEDDAQAAAGCSFAPSPQVVALPNATWPSDHLMLQAQFQVDSPHQKSETASSCHASHCNYKSSESQSVA